LEGLQKTLVKAEHTATFQDMASSHALDTTDAICEIIIPELAFGVPNPIHEFCVVAKLAMIIVTDIIDLAQETAYQVLDTQYTADTLGPNEEYDGYYMTLQTYKRLQRFEKWTYTALGNINYNLNSQHVTMITALQNAHSKMYKKVQENQITMIDSITKQHKNITSYIEVTDKQMRKILEQILDAVTSTKDLNGDSSNDGIDKTVTNQFKLGFTPLVAKESVKTILDNMEGKMEAMGNAVEGINDVMEGINDAMEGKVQSVEAKVDVIDDRLNNMEAMMALLIEQNKQLLEAKAASKDE